MPLSDDDAIRAYNDLKLFLQDHAMEWILVQVEEQIALGEIQIKPLDVMDGDLFYDDDKIFTPRKRARRKSSFAVAREYSPQERLLHLIEGIRIGVVQLNKIAGTITTFFKEEGSSSIQFEPDADVEGGFGISSEDFAGNRQAVENLLPLLQELTKELEYAA